MTLMDWAIVIQQEIAPIRKIQELCIDLLWPFPLREQEDPFHKIGYLCKESGKRFNIIRQMLRHMGPGASVRHKQTKAKINEKT